MMNNNMMFNGMKNMNLMNMNMNPMNMIMCNFQTGPICDPNNNFMNKVYLQTKELQP